MSVEEQIMDIAGTFRIYDMVRALLFVDDAADLIKVYNHLDALPDFEILKVDRNLANDQQLTSVTILLHYLNRMIIQIELRAGHKDPHYDQRKFL